MEQAPCRARMPPMHAIFQPYTWLDCKRIAKVPRDDHRSREEHQSLEQRLHEIIRNMV